MWSTNKLDLVNKNGAPICHHFGCRKHTKLIYANNGLFCQKHYIELQYLRDNIKHANDKNTEVYFREEEMLFRKRFDSGHVYYINKLNRELVDT